MLPFRRNGIRAAALAFAVACAIPATAAGSTTNGGVAPPPPQAPVEKAKIVDGLAVAPESAPRRVKLAIEAANRIVGKPYKYGGGHAKVEDTGYDCSGTVSYALIAAGLLTSPLPSGPFARWGERGRGQWITVYAHSGHAYMVIAGLRLDTSAYASRTARRSKKIARSAFERGPRWRPTSRPSRGFRARHPLGL